MVCHTSQTVNGHFVGFLTNRVEAYLAARIIVVISVMYVQISVMQQRVAKDQHGPIHAVGVVAIILTIMFDLILDSKNRYNSTGSSSYVPNGQRWLVFTCL